jgi:phosphate transport system substrate-binding protein
VIRGDEPPNQSLDKYRLIARLGTGGMADVFLAVRHGPVGFQRLLVVKRLRADLMGDTTFEGMLLAEARLAARLHHPNIVQTFEVGQDGKCPFIVMEYLDGQPLHRIAQAARSNPAILDPASAATIVAEALSGLHYAHELTNYDGTPLNIIHRDISPQNLFLTYDGEVKLVDFGIAKASLDEVATEVGVVKGKLTYMSPEQTCSARLDRRTDVFAMGVVLWELLANRRLFAFDSPVETLSAIAGGFRPKASDSAPNVAPELDAVCSRALEPDLDRRFQTAAEMREAIEDFLEHSRYRITRRDVLGRRLREHFSDERARMDQRIQACMSIAREEVPDDTPSTGSIPILNVDDHALGEDTMSGAKTRVESAHREHTTTAPIPLTQVRTRPPSSEVGPQSWRSTYLLTAAAVVGLAALSLTVIDRSRGQKASNSSASPLPTAAGGTSDMVLRLRGSNTIGAALAPALTEAFLRNEGATQVTRVPVPNAHAARVTATLPSKGTPQAVLIESEGSTTAFQGLLDGSCDIGMASRPIKPDEATQLQAKGLGDMRSPASEHVIALDGIAVIVHPNNPARTLTKPALARIFAGETSEWSVVGGAPGAISVYARDDVSGTFDTFKHLVLGDLSLVGTARRFGDSDQLSDAVASDPYGIGFIGLAYVRNAKAVSISDTGTPAMLPSAFTVTTEEYLLSRRLYFYSSPAPQNPLTLRFINFVLSTAGQKVVRDAGFVDLGIEVENGEPCDAHCTPGYAARARHARRLSVDFRFRSGRDELDSRAVRDLDRLVQFLRGHSSGKLMLLGFTSETGDAARNLSESTRRAKLVDAELSARGVHATVVEGRGAEMPVATNGDEAGRERNRRVEAWLRDEAP